MVKKLIIEDYLRASVAVDIVLFTIEDNILKLLTIIRKNEPFKNMRALPGGFVLKGENTLQTAERVLLDKTGLKDIYIEQLYTFDNPKRDPRGPVISVSYFALVPKSEISLQDSGKTQHPSLIPIKNLGKLAFDHNHILDYAYKRLRAKLEYSNIALSLLPGEFTFTELQNIYETIFSKKLDKRNFRKKILRLGLIKATTKRTRRGRQRPALLYKPTTTKPTIFKNSF